MDSNPSLFFLSLILIFSPVERSRNQRKDLRHLFLVSTSLNRQIKSRFDTLSSTPEKKFALRKFFKRFRSSQLRKNLRT